MTRATSGEMFRKVRQTNRVNAVQSVTGCHVSNTAKFGLLSRNSSQCSRDKQRRFSANLTAFGPYCQEDIARMRFMAIS